METILSISTDWESTDRAFTQDRKAKLVDKLIEITRDDTFSNLLSVPMPDQTFLTLASQLLLAYGFIVDIAEKLFVVKKPVRASASNSNAMSTQWDPSIDMTEEVWMQQHLDD